MELKNSSLVTYSSYQRSFPEQLSLTSGKLGCVCCVIMFCNLQCAISKVVPFSEANTRLPALSEVIGVRCCANIFKVFFSPVQSHFFHLFICKILRCGGEAVFHRAVNHQPSDVRRKSTRTHFLLQPSAVSEKSDDASVITS